uniref:Alpha/beta hydrolase fold n=1 Tax=Caulobacter sp. (strain K31) TaxID=366602 RepID=B0T6Q1_CAUSK
MNDSPPSGDRAARPGDLPIPGLFDGFAAIDVDTGRARFAGVIGGKGPAVLLLHGYPETHAAWHDVAPGLAEHHTVVAPDLPGYGRSLVADDGLWDKREAAAELVLLMRNLGHERFHVVGHDRGARVGYRMALEHPGQVRSFCSLAVVPILDVRPAVDWAFAKSAFHWFLLLQPRELVEKLLGADPDAFLDATLVRMAGSLDTLHPAALADYRAAFRRPEVRAAMIKDYQASDGADFANDAADRAAGRKIICPVLVLWSDERLVAEHPEGVAITAQDVWRRWADEVSAVAASCGHMIPEHAATEVVGAVLPFFEAAAARDLAALVAGSSTPKNIGTE